MRVGTDCHSEKKDNFEVCALERDDGKVFYVINIANNVSIYFDTLDELKRFASEVSKQSKKLK